MTGTDPARKRPNLRRAARYLLPYRRQLAAVLFISLAGTALSLYLPLLSRDLVDDALLGQDMAALVRTVSLFLAIPLASFALNVVSGMVYTKLSANVLFDMRVDVYAHLQRLSPRFFASRPLGDIVSRLNSDIAEIQRILAESALAWVTSTVYLAGTVGMLVYLDWRLFSVSIVLLPPSVWALVVYRRKLETSVRIVREQSADIGAFLIETIRATRLVVTSNAQTRELARFRGKNDDFVRALLSMRWLTYLAGGLPGLILVVSTGVVFLYGGSRVIEEAITLGTFVAFMAYQMRVLQPVRGLMGLYANLATAEVSLRRVDEIVDTEPEVVEARDAVALERVEGAVALDSVSLSFGRGGAVLREVSLEVAAGETVAIVGPSGSGKSTVVDLLVRQLDPDGGRILLDGADIRALMLASLRTHIVPVDQEPYIFNASLEENIRYARPGASDGEVRAAARAAGLEEFLASLPEGGATPAGEEGMTLSAGERQRVAIARAFLADPAVLVLDEATANLDPVSEERVIAGYGAVMAGRTTILVTHRFDLASRADRIVVLEEGRVVEEGRPRELTRSRGAFHGLFHGPIAGRDA